MPNVPGLVYLLCAATCLLCAAMLLRSYLQNHVRLLFWSSLCFFGLMIDNLILYYDVVIVPEVDLTIWRKLPGLVAIMMLLFGLIWESK